MKAKALSWTTPQDLRKQLQKLWDKGSILASMVDAQTLFPKRLALKAPSNTDLSERFEEVRQWIAALNQITGFRIETKTVQHRVLGENDIPKSAWVDSFEGAIKILGRQKEVSQFAELISTSQSRNPALMQWLIRKPLKALSLGSDWPRLLDIIDWLQSHPQPAIYLRQVDIPGIDSKFIEQNRSLLMALLDLSLPASNLNEDAKGASQFEARYGFLAKPARVRFRILDPDIGLVPGKMQDITLTHKDFSDLPKDNRIRDGIRKIFITENEINFLTLPPLPNSMVIFGAGYGFEALADVAWLSSLEVYYWGDIDTHGFAILNQLRARLPFARSFLMDESTLVAHKSFWDKESHPQYRDLPKLTGEEQHLYGNLRRNHFSDNLRLEQERIGFNWLLQALAKFE